MYIIKCGQTIYEIPASSFRFAAISKARDLKQHIRIDTNEDAANFLKVLGYEIFEQRD